ncbi:hypothetical protein VPH35_120899 [Triticum aestivum]
MEPSNMSMSSSILPADLLLEIAARSDPVTLVRCAATCKALRRQIADPAFLSPLRLRGADRFVPALFRGMFIQNLRAAAAEHPRFLVPGLFIQNLRAAAAEHPRFVVPGRSKEPPPEPFRSFLSKYTTLFDFYHPVLAARHGLVALRSDATPETEPAGACVFDPMTGYIHCFGPPGINAQSFVLLTGDGRRYRLLAAELSSGHLKTQAFSPAEHARLWQAIAETAVAPCPQDAALLHPPVVLQGDTHWLCRSVECHFVLKLSHAPLQASVTKIDGHCGEALRGRGPEEVLLVSDGGHARQPGLLVATGLEISLWTLSGSREGGGWSKQVLVQPESIRRPAGQWSERLELRWFGETSGGPSPSWYFMLELAARRVRGVCKIPPGDVLVFFPYEMDVSYWRPNFTRRLH